MKTGFVDGELSITGSQLAKRWGVSPHTVENWRARRKGPPYLKFTQGVRYMIADIEEFERKNKRLPK